MNLRWEACVDLSGTCLNACMYTFLSSSKELGGGRGGFRETVVRLSRRKSFFVMRETTLAR